MNTGTVGVGLPLLAQGLPLLPGHYHLFPISHRPAGDPAQLSRPRGESAGRAVEGGFGLEWVSVMGGLDRRRVLERG